MYTYIYIYTYKLCMSMFNVNIYIYIYIYISKIRHLLFRSYISVSFEPSKTQSFLNFLPFFREFFRRVPNAKTFFRYQALR